MSFNQPNYLTKESLETLKKEYDLLRNVTIPEIAKRIDDAKQQGDLSENAEYHQAREDMSWAQGRSQELEQIISNSQVFKSQKGGDTVALGTKVMVKVNKQEKEYTIVGPQEVNPVKGLISNESPLGQAFMGKKVGDKVEVVIPAGKQVFEIVKIG
jgi:transcription elongation factor GreA